MSSAGGYWKWVRIESRSCSFVHSLLQIVDREACDGFGRPRRRSVIREIEAGRLVRWVFSPGIINGVGDPARAFDDLEAPDRVSKDSSPLELEVPEEHIQADDTREHFLELIHAVEGVGVDIENGARLLIPGRAGQKC